jgi:hypothetical protein
MEDDRAVGIADLRRAGLERNTGIRAFPGSGEAPLDFHGSPPLENDEIDY